jgi:hypothetical protein
MAGGFNCLDAYPRAAKIPPQGALNASGFFNMGADKD